MGFLWNNSMKNYIIFLYLSLLQTYVFFIEWNFIDGSEKEGKKQQIFSKK